MDEIAETSPPRLVSERRHHLTVELAEMARLAASTRAFFTQDFFTQDFFTQVLARPPSGAASPSELPSMLHCWCRVSGN
jgi:hypothetical protein